MAQPLPRQESWDVYRPEPVRRAVQHLYALPYDFRTELDIPPPVVPEMDSWFRPAPEYVRGRTPTYLMGEPLFWHTETGLDVIGTIRGKIHRTIEVWLSTVNT